MESSQSIHSTTDNDKSNEYIKLPLTFGAMKLEDVLKYPGIDLKYLNFEIVPKQFYNLFIAESSLARRLGVKGDRGVYTADHIPVGKIVEIVSGKKLHSVKLRNCTFIIRCTGTKSYVDTYDYQTDSPYFFLALANDPLGILPPNLEIRFDDVNGVEQLFFLAIRPILPGEELCWEYNQDGGYWRDQWNNLPNMVQEQVLTKYGEKLPNLKATNSSIGNRSSPSIKEKPRTEDRLALDQTFKRVFDNLDTNDPLFIDIVSAVRKRTNEVEGSVFSHSIQETQEHEYISDNEGQLDTEEVLPQKNSPILIEISSGDESEEGFYTSFGNRDKKVGCEPAYICENLDLQYSSDNSSANGKEAVDDNNEEPLVDYSSAEENEDDEVGVAAEDVRQLAHEVNPGTEGIPSIMGITEKENEERLDYDDSEELIYDLGNKLEIISEGESGEDYDDEEDSKVIQEPEECEDITEDENEYDVEDEANDEEESQEEQQSLHDMMGAMVEGVIKGVLQLVKKIEVSKECNDVECNEVECNEVECNDDDSELMVEEEMNIDEGEEEYWEN